MAGGPADQAGNLLPGLARQMRPNEDSRATVHSPSSMERPKESP
jgi:hypothetical protein